MRYLKIYEEFGEESIESICKRYTINDDGSVDVDDNVNLSNIRGLLKVPLKFRNV